MLLLRQDCGGPGSLYQHPTAVARSAEGFDAQVEPDWYFERRPRLPRGLVNREKKAVAARRKRTVYGETRLRGTAACLGKLGASL